MSENVIQVLLRQHQEIQNMLSEMSGLLDSDSLDAAALVKEAERLENTLSTHERCEEEILFPEVKGMGPVQLVLQEHARLHTLRDNLSAAILKLREQETDDNAAALKTCVQEVAYCLSGHFMKEEQLAFKIAEVSITPERMAELTDKMNEIK